MIKKFIAFCLTITILLSFAACGKSDGDVTESIDNTDNINKATSSNESEEAKTDVTLNTSEYTDIITAIINNVNDGKTTVSGNYTVSVSESRPSAKISCVFIYKPDGTTTVINDADNDYNEEFGEVYNNMYIEVVPNEVRIFVDTHKRHVENNKLFLEEVRWLTNTSAFDPSEIKAGETFKNLNSTRVTRTSWGYPNTLSIDKEISFIENASEVFTQKECDAIAMQVTDMLSVFNDYLSANTTYSLKDMGFVNF